MNRSVTTIAAAEPNTQTAQRRATFTQLILQHEGDLARSARRLCSGDEDRAQDFVQDTLVRAYRACLSGRFREDADPRAWLLRIVTNLYINDYRRRRRWEAGDGLDSPTARHRMDEAARRAMPYEDPAALLMAATFDEDLSRALASLPEKLRLCTVLVDLEGLDYAQAAASLGIPIGTVRSRLSRARQFLRPLLWDYAQERRRVRA